MVPRGLVEQRLSLTKAGQIWRKIAKWHTPSPKRRVPPPWGASDQFAGLSEGCFLYRRTGSPLCKITGSQRGGSFPFIS